MPTMDSREESLVKAVLALKQNNSKSSEAMEQPPALDADVNFIKKADALKAEQRISGDKDQSQGSMFPRQLMDLLNQTELKDIIAWLPRGHAFVVKDYKRFSSQVLPKHFNKGVAYTSFTRRLVRWGFQNIAKCTYYNEHFHRDKPQLCALMSYNGSSKSPKNSPRGENKAATHLHGKEKANTQQNGTKLESSIHEVDAPRVSCTEIRDLLSQRSVASPIECTYGFSTPHPFVNAGRHLQNPLSSNNLYQPRHILGGNDSTSLKQAQAWYTQAVHLAPREIIEYYVLQQKLKLKSQIKTLAESGKCEAPNRHDQRGHQAGWSMAA